MNVALCLVSLDHGERTFPGRYRMCGHCKWGLFRGAFITRVLYFFGFGANLERPFLARRAELLGRSWGLNFRFLPWCHQTFFLHHKFTHDRLFGHAHMGNLRTFALLALIGTPE